MKKDKNNIDIFAYLILKSGEIIDLDLPCSDDGEIVCTNMFLDGILYTNAKKIDCSFNKISQLVSPFATSVNCYHNNITELNLPVVEYLKYDKDKVSVIYAPNLKDNNAN